MDQGNKPVNDLAESLTVRQEFSLHLESRRRANRVWQRVFLACTLLGVLSLLLLLMNILLVGWQWLDWDFLTSFPSRFPERAGIKSALTGTVWMMLLTALLTIPVGVASAIYLEEYARRSRWRALIQTNIANLAGVPSIVYGILGLAVFVEWLHLGRSLIAGALTMSLLILPLMIVVAQEAIRSVPGGWRHASYALGATKWQTVKLVVLPSALPGILTGTILSLSRAIGETAPLMAISALAFVAFTPRGLLDKFTVLPIQIYNWTSRPQDEFRGLAAAAIIVLLVVLLSMNSLAIFLRNKYHKRAE